MKQLSVRDLNFIEYKDQIMIAGIEICRKLGYAYPRQQAKNIWERHEPVLQGHSGVVKLTTPGGRQQIRCYDEAGARFFIAKCDMPLADQITMEMIEAFIQLRNEKTTYLDSRDDAKLMFRGLTDQCQIILKSEPDPQKRTFFYMNISKNNCKAVTGLSPKQIREQRNVKHTRDGLTVDELVKLSFLEQNQAVLLSKQNLSKKPAYQAIRELSAKFNTFVKEIEAV